MSDVTNELIGKKTLMKNKWTDRVVKRNVRTNLLVGVIGERRKGQLDKLPTKMTETGNGQTDKQTQMIGQSDKWMEEPMNLDAKLCPT